MEKHLILKRLILPRPYSKTWLTPAFQRCSGFHFGELFPSHKHLNPSILRQIEKGSFAQYHLQHEQDPNLANTPTTTSLLNGIVSC